MIGLKKKKGLLSGDIGRARVFVWDLGTAEAGNTRQVSVVWSLGQRLGRKPGLQLDNLESLTNRVIKAMDNTRRSNKGRQRPRSLTPGSMVGSVSSSPRPPCPPHAFTGTC